MHEALAGDYYHEELESVPEQTWSSATFFTAAVNGLLGLQVDGLSNRATFAPHLPPSWDALAIRNLHVGSSEISFRLVTSVNEMRLQMHNEGGPVKILFDPEIPLGAKLGSAHLQNQQMAVTLEQHSQDTHAKLEFGLPPGNALLTIGYTGGVAILPDSPPPMIGEPSKGIKIVRINLQGQVYTVDFDYLSSAAASFDLRTPWRIKDAQGAGFETISPDWYRFTVTVPAQEKNKRAYQHGTVTVTFAPNRGE